MRHQINGAGLAIGDVLLPATTVVDASANDEAARVARGKIPPSNATPLDDEAYDLMLKHYGPDVLKFYGVVRP
jgi:hypothetical protein